MSDNDWKGPRDEVQKLALWGYRSHCSLHLVLTVVDADRARAFIHAVLNDRLLTFGDGGANRDAPGLNLGFTYRGLAALGLPVTYLDALAARSPAFREGAASRAARRLGDTGASAAERWEPMFAADRAEVVISIHDDRMGDVYAKAKALEGLVANAFDGWDNGRIEAAHLGPDRDDRRVHFGFRDNLSRQRIVDQLDLDEKERRKGFGDHLAGELLIGHDSDTGFDRWRVQGPVTDKARGFFANGSFAALRKIAQDEVAFADFLMRAKASVVGQGASPLSDDQLKAKLCGRWPDGAVVRPWSTLAQNETPEPDFAFVADPQGYPIDPDGIGCPFGSHLRRTNPRDDPLAPPQLRTLFRRGMPYGAPYKGKPDNSERGLVGLFFCASLDEQFEVVMSEWVEGMPMSTKGRGRAKDPLIGHHDDPDAKFHIPRDGAPDLVIGGFDKPFVTTRGTLYALYPSLSALREMTEFKGGRKAPAEAPAPSSGPSRSPRKWAAGAPPAEPAAKAVDRASDDTAPVDRYCDLVMEGGVTSGVVHIAAAARLARYYRFQCIGGSSIGAFAAALTAAAEYCRRKGSMAGFEQLEALPKALGDEVDGKTLLERLFNPQPAMRRLFAVFLAATGGASVGPAWRAALREAWCQYGGGRAWAAAGWTALWVLGVWIWLWVCWPSFRESLEPTLSAGSGMLMLLGSALALVPALALTSLALLVRGLVRDLRSVPDNGFGLCRGGEPAGADGTPDLAQFLHMTLQRVAGLGPDDAPLTFAQLWRAPGGPREVLDDPSPASEHSIHLEVYTTSLTQGRPFRFPLPDPNSDDPVRLYFRRELLADYFPRDVVDAMVRVASPYEPKPGPSNPSAVNERWLGLPAGELPVVVAVRIAISFPFLVSAVPLGAMNYEPEDRPTGIEPCWMSDGGLCSNFPIHLFDSLVPRWPTFGIALFEAGRVKRDPWLPNCLNQGHGDTRYGGMDERRGRLARLGGLVTAAALAAFRWNDRATLRLPGVRDRVVRVFLKEGEGGLNLRMKDKQINTLADYGRQAAHQLIAKFAVPGSPGWPEQRWVRWMRLLGVLQSEMKGVRVSAQHAPHTQALRDQIEAAAHAPPARKLLRIDDDQKRRLLELLDALEALERATDMYGPPPYVPIPRSVLRVRHSL